MLNAKQIEEFERIYFKNKHMKEHELVDYICFAWDEDLIAPLGMRGAPWPSREEIKAEIEYRRKINGKI